MQTPIDRFKAAERFPALDGLRAIAVLAVVGFHARIPGDRLFTNGAFGVELFFALSGFLITTLLLREQQRYGAISLQGFYIRRTARIFPAYYAVLALYALVTWRVEPTSPEGTAFFAHLPIYATYLNNWLIDARPDGGRVIFLFAWSLAVEEQFYLVWPSIIKFARSLLLPFVVAVVAALSHRYFTAIGLGCVLALLVENQAVGPRLVRYLAHPVVLPISLLAVANVIALGGHWPILLQAFIAMVAVGSAAVSAPSVSLRMLSTRGLRYIGSISYGIYLLHMLALHAAQKLLPGQGYLTAALGTLIVLAAASVSFRVYEQPIQRWARGRFASRRMPVAPPEMEYGESLAKKFTSG